MRRLLLFGLFSLLCSGFAFADITVVNRSDRLVEIYVNDGGASWGKSFRLQTGEKYSFDVSSKGGYIEVRSMETKTKGEVLNTTKFQDKEVLTVKNNDEGEITVKKTRKF